MSSGHFDDFHPEPVPRPGDHIDPLLRSITAVELAKGLRIPCSLIDGRPWVPTEQEADPGA